MSWIKKLLGIRPIDLKQKEVAVLREKAMMAQRSGDLKAYGNISKKIEEYEDEIIELIRKTVAS